MTTRKDKPMITKLRTLIRSKCTQSELKAARREVKNFITLHASDLPSILVQAYNKELLEIERLLRADSDKIRARQPCAIPDETKHKNDAPKVEYRYSAIICLYRRGNVDKVIEALRRQTLQPEMIILLVNGLYINTAELRSKYESALVIQSDINSLYTRWAIGYIANSEYLLVLDDDQTPGRNYVQRSIALSRSKNALVCGSGRRYNPQGKHGFFENIGPYAGGKYSHSTKVGPLECDWGCNSYLFKREWISFALAAPRYNGLQLKVDDIQLAYNLYTYGGISCWVSQQDSEKPESLHTRNPELGTDAEALWKKSNHFKLRKDYIEHLVGFRSFKTVNARNKESGNETS
jgi:glycosyltransferase involved in cell wall biosynthesis